MVIKIELGIFLVRGLGSLVIVIVGGLVGVNKLVGNFLN